MRASELRHTPTLGPDGCGTAGHDRPAPSTLAQPRRSLNGAVPGRHRLAGAIICLSEPPKTGAPDFAFSSRRRHQTTRSESTMEELRERLTALADHVAGIMVRL